MVRHRRSPPAEQERPGEDEGMCVWFDSGLGHSYRPRGATPWNPRCEGLRPHTPYGSLSQEGLLVSPPSVASKPDRSSATHRPRRRASTRALPRTSNLRCTTAAIQAPSSGSTAHIQTALRAPTLTAPGSYISAFVRLRAWQRSARGLPRILQISRLTSSVLGLAACTRRAEGMKVV